MKQRESIREIWNRWDRRGWVKERNQDEADDENCEVPLLLRSLRISLRNRSYLSLSLSLSLSLCWVWVSSLFVSPYCSCWWMEIYHSLTQHSSQCVGLISPFQLGFTYPYVRASPALLLLSSPLTFWWFFLYHNTPNKNVFLLSKINLYPLIHTGNMFSLCINSKYIFLLCIIIAISLFSFIYDQFQY